MSKWHPLGMQAIFSKWLQWRHNEHNGFSNHLCLHYLLNCLLGHRSKKTLKLHSTDLCEGNSLVTSEFPRQRASNTKNVSIWWCHNGWLSISVYSWWIQPLAIVVFPIDYENDIRGKMFFIMIFCKKLCKMSQTHQCGLSGNLLWWSVASVAETLRLCLALQMSVLYI